MKAKLSHTLSRKPSLLRVLHSTSPINRYNYLHKYNFCSKSEPDQKQFTNEGKELIEKKYESEINKKMKSLLRGEIFPILLLTVLGVLTYTFWDQLMNLSNFQRASDKEMKYIARKVATYLRYSLTAAKYDEERIEHEIVQEVYQQILACLQVKGLKSEVTVYSADDAEIYMLPNGSLFVSNTLLTSLTDVRQLIFIILRHFELLRLDYLSKNLSQRTKYGDFRREYFFFKSRYTGYDILFINYLTKTRYTLNQVRQADVNAVHTMKSLKCINPDYSYSKSTYSSILLV